MNILELPERKRTGDKLAMVTCYDYTSARLVAKSGIDMILVGDSAAMVMHGHATTLPIGVDTMALHVAAVARGAPRKFIVADLPFLAHRKGLAEAMNAVETLMKAGAHAVKLEGLAGNETTIHHVVESGVPVMGHLGLTPQSVHALGGFRVQGRDEAARERLREDALAAQAAGCFALVLECVPATLAADVTRRLRIPTVGIGAGEATDGQVLVLQDLLGLGGEATPRFVRRYLDGEGLVLDAFERWVDDVRHGRFPGETERYAG